MLQKPRLQVLELQIGNGLKLITGAIEYIYIYIFVLLFLGVVE